MSFSELQTDLASVTNGTVSTETLPHETGSVHHQVNHEASHTETGDSIFVTFGDEEGSAHTPPTPAKPPTRPDPKQVWQARAVRYLAIYLLLCSAVLGVRYATRNTYPHLRELRRQVADLQVQRDTLDLQVQQLTTGPRVLTWAQTHGMIPYAQARKQSQTFTALPAPKVSPEQAKPIEMTTLWK